MPRFACAFLTEYRDLIRSSCSGSYFLEYLFSTGAMTLSPSNFLFCCVLIFYSFAEAATRVYNFTAEWVRANPDGLFERPVIGINGQWPIPRIEATVGDRLIVNLNNNLGNQSTSIHFHGLFMNSTSNMDGVVGTTQCGVPPGGTFTYNFTVLSEPPIFSP